MTKEHKYEELRKRIASLVPELTNQDVWCSRCGDSMAGLKTFYSDVEYHCLGCDKTVFLNGNQPKELHLEHVLIAISESDESYTIYKGDIVNNSPKKAISIVWNNAPIDNDEIALWYLTLPLSKQEEKTLDFLLEIIPKQQ